MCQKILVFSELQVCSGNKKNKNKGQRWFDVTGSSFDYENPPNLFSKCVPVFTDSMHQDYLTSLTSSLSLFATTLAVAF
jgi:hypothetical protein